MNNNGEFGLASVSTLRPEGIRWIEMDKYTAAPLSIALLKIILTPTTPPPA